MNKEGNSRFTANDADRLEQQEEVGEEPSDESDAPLEAASREANEADVAEQARSVYGDDEYPRGPIDEEPV